MVKDRIRKGYGNLPRNQRTIADWTLSNLERVPFMSVQDIADQTGFSDASIVRFSQRIGFTGFTAMKEALVDGVVDQLNNVQLPVLEELGEQGESILVQVANQDIRNIRETLQQIDEESFKRAVSAILDAKRVHTAGKGISYLMARILAYQLRQIGLHSNAYLEAETSFAENSLFIQPDDLIIAFSFPPYSRETITLCERMADQQQAVLTITDSQTSPTAQFADQVLVVRSENMLYTNSFSAISVVINAISTECARRTPDTARQMVTRMNLLAEENDEYQH